jgi:hypothetical protein
MSPSKILTPDEAARVDQALKESEAGDFVDWSGLKGSFRYIYRARRNDIWSQPTQTLNGGSLLFWTR